MNNKGLRWILALAVLAILGWGLMQKQPTVTPFPVAEPVAVVPQKTVEVKPEIPVKSLEDEEKEEKIVISTMQNPTPAAVELDLRELKLKVQVDGPAVPWRTRSAGTLNNLPVVLEITNTRTEVNSLRGLQFSALNQEGGNAGLVLQTQSAMVAGSQTRRIKLTLQLPDTSIYGFLGLHYQSVNGKKQYSAVIKLP